ncbi:hypothetical protein AB6F62_07995 [Providencia huaxiensis]|uniref:hypothetical protein n=1 Tax=Providencia huaxiensis TaxID=2027290 RepID=UPI0034DD519F
MNGCILYGVKVNQSNVLLRTAIEENIGVDVSSLHEWRDANQYGISPEKFALLALPKQMIFSGN